MSLKITIGSRKLTRELRKEIAFQVGELARESLRTSGYKIESAIDEAVEKRKKDYIPTPTEAGELGIGEDGRLDKYAMENAYKVLEFDAPENVWSYDISITEGTGFGLIGEIEITADYESLFEATICNIELDDGEDLPWMEWLLDGAPIIPGYEYKAKKIKTSRTGKGYMKKNKSTLWSFPPARGDYVKRMFTTLEFLVAKAIADEIERDLLRA